MKQKMIVTKVFEKEIYMFSDLPLANFSILLDLSNEDSSIEIYQAETWVSMGTEVFDKMCEIITEVRNKENKKSQKKNTRK